MGSGLLARAVIGQFSRKLAGILFSFGVFNLFWSEKTKVLRSKEMIVALLLTVLELSVCA